MTTPRFLGTDFRRVSLTGVTDVQTIIDEIVEEITLNLPAASRWSDEGGGEYKTPPDSAGRFMTVTLTRISATRYAFHVRDQNGNTVHDGTNDITAPSPARIWSGPHHLIVETIASTFQEIARAIMVDPAPLALSSHARYVYGMNRRNSSGTQINPNGFEADWLSADDAGGEAQRIVGLMNSSAFNPGTVYETVSGTLLILPVLIFAEPSSNNFDLAGKAFQMIAVEGAISPGTVLTVPVDVGVSGDFEVLGLAEDDASSSIRLAARKA